MRSRQSRESGIVMKWAGYVLGSALALYVIWAGVRNIRGSSYTPDRLNIVIYDQVPVLLSLGLSDKVNYVVTFSHEDKVYAPGGYGRYRVGALGKLAHLEQDADLVSRAFSSMISAHVDYSLVPRSSTVYEDLKGAQPDFTALTIAKHVFSDMYTFDGGLIDKVYVLYKLASYRSSNFIQLAGTFKEDPDGDIIFSEKRFQKKYRGFFYHKTLRDEAKNVQIEYSTYSAGAVLSRIIEGQGIRVVDLRATEKPVKTCEVLYQGLQKPLTVDYIAERFSCEARSGKVEGAEILIRMSANMDERWK